MEADRYKRWIREAIIEIRKQSVKTMNRDEGQYQLIQLTFLMNFW